MNGANDTSPAEMLTFPCLLSLGRWSRSHGVFPKDEGQVQWKVFEKVHGVYEISCGEIHMT